MLNGVLLICSPFDKAMVMLRTIVFVPSDNYYVLILNNKVSNKFVLSGHKNASRDFNLMYYIQKKLVRFENQHAFQSIRITKIKQIIRR